MWKLIPFNLSIHITVEKFYIAWFGNVWISNFLIMAYINAAKNLVAHISRPVLMAHVILNMCTSVDIVRIYSNFVLKS